MTETTTETKECEICNGTENVKFVDGPEIYICEECIDAAQEEVNEMARREGWI